jgi:magnesium transporter
MLTFHDGSANYKNLTSANLSAKVNWIDIMDGDAAEIALLEKDLGRHIPTRDELEEIENSSRLRSEHGTFCLSTPLVARDEQGMPYGTPVGFIVTKDRLVTIRFAPLTAFASFADEYRGADGVEAFVGLIDAIVDRAADVMENVGTDLDQLSQRIFGGESKTMAMKLPPAKETTSLRDILRRIGRNGDLSSKIRDSLLGVGRIVSFVNGLGTEWISAEQHQRLETQKQDIASLADYENHLANKVQLLLDATMGLINIEQNNIIKVLTIVSVVGVPPTLIASMYGMNFQHMPELSWSWGYEYGLALIFLSAVLPILWFKKRGWL